MLDPNENDETDTPVDPTADPAADASESAGEGAQGPDPVEPEIVEPPPPPPTEEQLLRARLEEANARLRAVSKAYTDAQAEMHAFRERMEHQAKFKAERQAYEQARAFFDPVQNLKRSVTAEQDHEALVSGLHMVIGQFMEALHKLGMEAVPGVGTTFDPRLHEALAISPVTDPAQDGKVLVVHADGWTVQGKVLQAAQVVVGKYQDAGEA